MSKNLQNKGWAQMSGLLNDAMPVTIATGHGKSLVLLLFTIAVIGSGIYGYYFFSSDNSSSPFNAEYALQELEDKELAKIGEFQTLQPADIISRPSELQNNEIKVQRKDTDGVKIEPSLSLTDIKTDDLSTSVVQPTNLTGFIHSIESFQSEKYAEAIELFPDKEMGTILSDDPHLLYATKMIPGMLQMVTGPETSLSFPGKLNSGKFSRRSKSYVQAFAMFGSDVYKEGALAYGAGLQLKRTSHSSWEYFGELGFLIRNLEGNGTTILKDEFERFSNSEPDAPGSPVPNQHKVANVSVGNASFVHYGLGVNYRLKRGFSIRTALVFQHLLNIDLPEIIQSPFLSNGEFTQEQLLRYEITERFKLHNSFDILPCVGIQYSLNRLSIGFEYRHSFFELIRNSDFNNGLGQRTLSFRTAYTF